MGQKADQNAFPSTYRPEPSSSARLSPSRAAPPPLPPRQPSTTSPALDDAPPAYSEAAPVFHSQPTTESWSAQDPRSSSTQSLVPHEQSEDGDKRRLLLIWIHGFMGDETSFQSFPAHVHNALCQVLQERGDGKYAVHTKIYPRYKSRNKIYIARDMFGDWLAPHEDAKTDIILLGHSLGGILSAEVALKQDVSGRKRYCHRILGTINFDTPFLGMHPGVISSGLSSLFRPAADPSSTAPTATNSGASSLRPDMGRTDSNIESSSSSGTPLQASSSNVSNRPSGALSSTNSYSTTSSGPPLSLPTSDPNYDPPFKNDVRQIQRSGWSNVWHFVNKHTDGATLMAKGNALSHAIKSYVTSHAEFGGCLADIKGLRVRYRALRELEDGKDGERIRFVNYYTACTGRPKRRSPSPLRRTAGAQDDGVDELAQAVERDLRTMQSQPPGEDAVSSTPRSSVEETEKIVPTDHVDHQHHAGAEVSHNKALSLKSSASSTVRLSPAPTEDSDDEKLEASLTSAHPPDQPPSAESAHQPAIPVPTQRPPSPPSQPSPTPSQPPTTTLPPIPSPPTTPPPFDPSPYPTKETLKLAQKAHARALKQHAQQTKDRARAIKDREKLLAKQESAARKASAKAEAKAQKLALKRGKGGGGDDDDDGDGDGDGEGGGAGDSHARAEKQRLREEEKRMQREARRLRGETTPVDSDNEIPTDGATSDPPTSVPPTPPRRSSHSSTRQKKPPSDKVFCILPSSSLSSPLFPQDQMGQGKGDRCWVRVFMEGVDEVGAHCGLFFVDGGGEGAGGGRGGGKYEWLVADVAGRVGGWVGL